MVAMTTDEQKLEWDDLTDQNGNELAVGTEVQYAIGSKLRSGLCIIPMWVYPKPRKSRKQDDDDDFTDAVIEGVEPLPGVLIYNHTAPNRKNVVRACEDVCVLTS